jgi:hypothetical protein
MARRPRVPGYRRHSSGQARVTLDGKDCLLRPFDIDMSHPACWVYRPGSDRGPHGAHKTAHHGHDHPIFIGPRAQAILRPYLDTKLDAYCFSPAESEHRRSADRRQMRKTPLTVSIGREVGQNIGQGPVRPIGVDVGQRLSVPPF